MTGEYTPRAMGDFGEKHPASQTALRGSDIFDPATLRITQKGLMSFADSENIDVLSAGDTIREMIGTAVRVKSPANPVATHAKLPENGILYFQHPNRTNIYYVIVNKHQGKITYRFEGISPANK